MAPGRSRWFSSRASILSAAIFQKDEAFQVVAGRFEIVCKAGPDYSMHRTGLPPIRAKAQEHVDTCLDYCDAATASLLGVENALGGASDAGCA